MGNDNMKKLVLWTVIVAAALVIRLLKFPRSLDVAWRVSSDTHRGIPASHLIFWVLILIVGLWAIWDVLVYLRRLPN